MQKIINKELVKRRFQRSLKTYKKEATVQKMMASNLINFLTDNTGNKFNKVLEIGCGTGNLTEQIKLKLDFETLIANDIVEDSEQYIQAISSQISFLPGDAEDIVFESDFDLIISNASFQWISDISEFFKKLHSCLNNNGILAFTTFSPDNFQEISQITNSKLQYDNNEKLLSNISDLFTPVYKYNENIKLEFNNPLDVLEHIKQMGVNSIDQRIWTKKKLNEFKINYIKHFSNDGKVSLTYCPEYFILKAK